MIIRQMALGWGRGSKQGARGEAMRKADPIVDIRPKNYTNQPPPPP